MNKIITSKRTKVKRVGIDLDGVLALQSMKGLWFHLRKLKELLLRKSSVKNYYLPQGSLEKQIWKTINQYRKPYKDNNGLLKKVCELPNIELYLVTSRYSFMKAITNDWLNKYQFITYFKKIIENEKDQNPHDFKVNVVNQLQLDYFIDDDWETITALHGETNAKIIWIYERDIKNKKIPETIAVEKDLFEALKLLLQKLS